VYLAVYLLSMIILVTSLLVRVYLAVYLLSMIILVPNLLVVA
jgi:hypothetical protein